MDKYRGIKKSESISYEINYEIKNVKKEPNKRERESDSKNSSSFVFNVVRFAICFLLIGVCAVGKFLDFEPATTASNYIKAEMERDLLEDFSDLLILNV